MPCARRWTGCCQCSFAPPGRDLGPGAGQLYERRRSRGRANAQGLALWSGTGWCAWPRTKRGGDLVCFGRPPASTGVDAHRVARAASRRRPHVTCRDWPPTTAGRRWLALLPSAREELGSQRGELATRVLESATTSRACTPIDGALASPGGKQEPECCNAETRAIGKELGVPMVATTEGAGVAAHFGLLGAIASLERPPSGSRTRQLLGCSRERPCSSTSWRAMSRGARGVPTCSRRQHVTAITTP